MDPEPDPKMPAGDPTEQDAKAISAVSASQALQENIRSASTTSSPTQAADTPKPPPSPRPSSQALPPASSRQHSLPTIPAHLILGSNESNTRQATPPPSPRPSNQALPSPSSGRHSLPTVPAHVIHRLNKLNSRQTTPPILGSQPPKRPKLWIIVPEDIHIPPDAYPHPPYEIWHPTTIVFEYIHARGFVTMETFPDFPKPFRDLCNWFNNARSEDHVKENVVWLGHRHRVDWLQWYWSEGEKRRAREFDERLITARTLGEHESRNRTSVQPCSIGASGDETTMKEGEERRKDEELERGGCTDEREREVRDRNTRELDADDRAELDDLAREREEIERVERELEEERELDDIMDLDLDEDDEETDMAMDLDRKEEEINEGKGKEKEVGEEKRDLEEAQIVTRLERLERLVGKLEHENGEEEADEDMPEDWKTRLVNRQGEDDPNGLSKHDWEVVVELENTMELEEGATTEEVVKEAVGWANDIIETGEQEKRDRTAKMESAKLRAEMKKHKRVRQVAMVRHAGLETFPS
ncbi:MAG: hypothetical protein Q9209_007718 [Squamulea sp. 1 TL-2023]